MTICRNAITLGDMLPDPGDDEGMVNAWIWAIATATYKAPCCEAVAEGDLLACTCWTKVHDKDQTPPIDGSNSGVQPRMCGACAYRSTSPERTGLPAAAFDDDRLRAIVEAGEPFWCHEGMRQVIALVHEPTGVRIEIPFELDYDPPIISATPYQADGTRALLCAGWSGHRVKYLAAQTAIEKTGAHS